MIKIASPSDTHPDPAQKANVYLQAGVARIGVIWPATRTVEVWQGTAAA